MKPTVSYVRGLRDVKDISTSEERKTYIKKRERNSVLGIIGGGLASILFLGGGTYLELPTIQFAFTSLTSITILAGVMYYGSKRETIEETSNYPISKIARCQQHHIKIRNRAPTDIPEYKLGLDDF